MSLIVILLRVGNRLSSQLSNISALKIQISNPLSSRKVTRIPTKVKLIK